MYRVSVNNLQYRYDALADAVHKMCSVLAKFNLVWWADKGTFSKTSAFGSRSKVKKYTIKISVPNLTLELMKMDKEEMYPEVVENAIEIEIKRYKKRG